MTPIPDLVAIGGGAYVHEVCFVCHGRGWFRAPERLPAIDRQLIDNAIRAVTHPRPEMQLAMRGRS